MRPSRPLQDDERVVRTLNHEQGAHQIEVIAMGRERIESHRSFYPGDGCRRLAQEGEIDAALNDEARVIWIKLQCTFQMMFALGKLPLDQRNAAHHTMAFCVVFIDRHRAFNRLYHFSEKFRGTRPKLIV